MGYLRESPPESSVVPGKKIITEAAVLSTAAFICCIAALFSSLAIWSRGYYLGGGYTIGVPLGIALFGITRLVGFMEKRTIGRTRVLVAVIAQFNVLLAVNAKPGNSHAEMDSLNTIAFNVVVIMLAVHFLSELLIHLTKRWSRFSKEGEINAKKYELTLTSFFLNLWGDDVQKANTKDETPFLILIAVAFASCLVALAGLLQARVGISVNYLFLMTTLGSVTALVTDFVFFGENLIGRKAEALMKLMSFCLLICIVFALNIATTELLTYVLNTALLLAGFSTTLALLNAAYKQRQLVEVNSLESSSLTSWLR